jgi:hypothetical protein
MGLLQKLTGRRHHPVDDADDKGAAAPRPAISRPTISRPTNSRPTDDKFRSQRGNRGWFALFAGRALAEAEPASGPLPDLSEALRCHRRKTRHEWLDSAPVQSELLEAFNGVFDEAMTDGLGLADATGPDIPPSDILPADIPPADIPLADNPPSDIPPAGTPALAAEPADQQADAAEEEMPDGFTMLFRAHG